MSQDQDQDEDAGQLPETRAARELSRRERVSIRALVDTFLRRRSPNTFKAYSRDLKAFAEHLGEPDIYAAIERWVTMGKERGNMVVLEWLVAMTTQRRLAATTVNRRLAALRSCLKLARLSGHADWFVEVENVPATGYVDTSGPGVDGYKLLLAELDRREATAVNKAAVLRDRAIVTLLFSLALRRHEVAQLNAEHVEFERGRLVIRGKGRTQESYVTLTQSATRALERWLAWRGTHPGPLFVSFDPAGKGSGRLAINSITRMVDRLGKAAGVDTTPHGLRHAAITAALDLKNDLREVQRFSRHKRIETVLIYDDNRQDLGGKVAKDLDRLFSDAAPAAPAAAPAEPAKDDEAEAE